MQTKQPELFSMEDVKVIDNQEWGTFKDSLRAPVHNWFTYPAGFSHKAVEASIHKHGISADDVIYDPFMGSGTTNLVAKKLGINSYGVEAHPFVFRITKTKLNWEINKSDVIKAVESIKITVSKKRKSNISNLNKYLSAKFPELLLKCYEDRTLFDLMLIRDAIADDNFSEEMQDLLFVGLTSILRQVSSAATGWPYIAPKKMKTTSLDKDALIEFSHHMLKMADDLATIRNEAIIDYKKTYHKIFNSDSRDTNSFIPGEVADHVFTSPPYLNNFDYADRTRLELYFWGEAKTWGDITKSIRTKLITSATTQIARDDPKYDLSSELNRSSPQVYDFLSTAISQLGALRLTKGGKKSYDHLVSGYFNDIFLIVTDVFRILKPNTTAVFVLGDSAPYGVYIPTDELIGKIGLGVGFSDYSLQTLRIRGGKWKNNPQRHNVALRESIVTLTKG